MFEELIVSDVKLSTSSAKLITLQIPEELREQYSYVPGQYVTVSRVDDNTTKRCYSICSTVDNSNIQIGVKKVIGGKMSTYLVDEIKKGDVLSVSPPEGNFKLHTDSLAVKSYVFIAGGSGITPIRSMIDHILVEEPRSKLVLIYGNRDKDNIIFHDYFQKLADHPRIHIIHCLEHPPESFDCESGMLTYEKLYELIKVHIPTPKKSKYYICGPNAVMQNAEKALGSFFVPKSNVFLEYFTFETSQEVPQNEKTYKVEIQTASDRYDIPVNPQESILDAALRNGIDLPYSCKQGICSSCKQKKLSGEVQQVQDHGLSAKDKKDNYVLLCQCYPLSSDVKINCSTSGKAVFGKRRTNRRIGITAGLLVALVILGAMTMPKKKSMLALGHMNPGHENLLCSDCHTSAKGTAMQQLNANIKYLLGNRKSSVSFGSDDVDNKKCLSCHNRPNDRHPVHRFNEPRFAEARKSLGAQNCESCHSEHKDQRIVLDNLAYCQQCHTDTEITDDPLDVSHATLMEQNEWKTCLQCHDFHGNHVMETPHLMKDTIPFALIEAYGKGGKDPYGNEKTHVATETAEEIIEMFSK